MSRKNIFGDPKITTKHQTIVDGALPVLDTLRKLDEVSKIVLGPIEPNKSATPRVKATDIRAGLLVKVQGTDSLQQFWVYTNKPEVIRKKIDV